jgi:hypothetical protein
VEARAGNSNHDNNNAVRPVNRNPEEHEEQAKLEPQDAYNVAVPPVSPFVAAAAFSREDSSQGALTKGRHRTEAIK